MKIGSEKHDGLKHKKWKLVDDKYNNIQMKVYKLMIVLKE